VSVRCEVDIPTISNGAESLRIPITVSFVVFPVCLSSTSIGIGSNCPSSK